MKRERLIWTIVFVLGGLGLLFNAVIRPSGMAKQYVMEQLVSLEHPEEGMLTVAKTPLEHHVDPQHVHYSVWRTAGVWIAAFFTLCIFSFLYRDNPFYKFAESVFIGVSAAAIMIAAFWEQIVPNLFAEITPQLMKISLYPAVESESIGPHHLQWWARVAVLVFGIMLLWRLAPRGQWIARWPLAFIVGTFAGIKLISYLDADFVNQIRSTIMPLVEYARATECGKRCIWALTYDLVRALDKQRAVDFLFLLSRDNVRVIRPGDGLAPALLPSVLGRRAGVAISRGTPIAWNLLSD